MCKKVICAKKLYQKIIKFKNEFIHLQNKQRGKI